MSTKPHNRTCIPLLFLYAKIHQNKPRVAESFCERNDTKQNGENVAGGLCSIWESFNSLSLSLSQGKEIVVLVAMYPTSILP